jgi:hypothetical protein
MMIAANSWAGGSRAHRLVWQLWVQLVQVGVGGKGRPGASQQ